MLTALIAGVGGFIGTILRHGVSLLVGTYWFHKFPLATFLINVTGSFVIGYFMTFAGERATMLDPVWKLFFVTGILGGYTTFSAFEYETLRLSENNAWGWATTYVVASVVLGFWAARLGALVARA